ncbi:unnamed protein product [Paramecium sonneborni]|uniref:Uncharacterized protein n=1 Tax=Paramecium sonneborni TaxID=65129 RepID=A0A8S1LW89_9CILI|nr:unnamed protein product [Paramecium sonneborni]
MNLSILNNKLEYMEDKQQEQQFHQNNKNYQCMLMVMTFQVVMIINLSITPMSDQYKINNIKYTNYYQSLTSKIKIKQSQTIQKLFIIDDSVELHLSSIEKLRGVECGSVLSTKIYLSLLFLPTLGVASGRPDLVSVSKFPLKSSPNITTNLNRMAQCGFETTGLLNLALNQTNGPPKTLLPKQQLKQIGVLVPIKRSEVLKSAPSFETAPTILFMSVSVVFDESQNAFIIYLESKNLVQYNTFNYFIQILTNSSSWQPIWRTTRYTSIFIQKSC